MGKPILSSPIVVAYIDAVAAQLAGFGNLKVYDGSWSEWGEK